ncbi:lactonase family protein [Rhizobium sp. BK251]|uniref:lactonase family protein n=1 Tax=Rhizobium sp. BK251 TaxID=2512125 RepID=UPI0010ECB65D|nr:lactonase family protein [Rhizobium sp. BK251]TCL71104.1 6-phosphogluconolactonase [Rhizobium sp. BK251]
MHEKVHLFIGSLNRPVSFCREPKGEGISILSFDEATGAIELVARRSDVDNPCFLTVDAEKGVVYANTEVHEWREGLVSAWRFDGTRNTLAYINVQPSLGCCTAYSRISGDGKHLYVVNYAIDGGDGPDQSLIVYGIREDGGLTPPLASLQFAHGTGPNAERQERSHPHCIVELKNAAGSTILAVTDLGTDRIELIGLEEGLRLVPLSHAGLAAGAGPRHLALHPNGRFVYAINELHSTVSTFARKGDSFSVIDTRSCLPASFSGTSYAADLHLSTDGCFLYGSNRGHDSIAIFSIDPETGIPQSLGHAETGGRTPRSFALTPSGRHIVAANQDGNSLTIFARNEETGLLTKTGSHAIGTPVSVRIIPTKS